MGMRVEGSQGETSQRTKAFINLAGKGSHTQRECVWTKYEWAKVLKQPAGRSWWGE